MRVVVKLIFVQVEKKPIPLIGLSKITLKLFELNLTLRNCRLTICLSRFSKRIRRFPNRGAANIAQVFSVTTSHCHRLKKCVAIWYTSENQRNAIEARVEKICRGAGKKRSDLGTAIEPATDFYRAEEYHQKYYAKARGTYAPKR